MTTHNFCNIIALSFYWIGLGLYSVDSQRISALTDPDSTPHEGQAVTLKCELLDYRGEVAILWLKDGMTIIDNHQVISESLQSRAYLNQTDDNAQMKLVSDLVILQSSRNDTGSYQCQAKSLPGDSDIGSASLRLNVLYNPGNEYPKCNPDNEIRVRIGEQMTLSCVSDDGNPMVDLVWYKQSGNFEIEAPLEAETRTADGLITSSLTLITTLHDTNEMFVCNITGDHLPQNETRSCNISMKVIWPSPAIAVFVYPSQQTIQVNSSAEFSCHTAFPPDRKKSEVQDKHLEWVTPQTDSSLIEVKDNLLTIFDVGTEENIIPISCLVMFENRWFEATSMLYVVDDDAISEVNSNISYNPWNITFPTESPDLNRVSSTTSNPEVTVKVTSTLDKVIKSTHVSNLDKCIDTPFCWVPAIVAALLLFLLIIATMCAVCYLRKYRYAKEISPRTRRKLMRQSESQTDLYNEDGNYMELDGRSRVVRLSSVNSGSSGPYTDLLDSSTSVSTKPVQTPQTPTPVVQTNNGFVGHAVATMPQRQNATEEGHAAVHAFHSALKNLAELDYEYVENATGGMIKVKLAGRPRAPEPPNSARREPVTTSNYNTMRVGNNIVKNGGEDYYQYGYPTDAQL